MPTSDTTSAASPIRVFLLIENRLLREALFRLFRKHSDIRVVGQGGRAYLNPLPPLDKQCELLIIDSAEFKCLVASIALDTIGETARKTILIGMEPDEELFLAAVRSGVSGFLLQDASASDVVAAVRSISRGEGVCPPQLCSTLFRVVANQARAISIQSTNSRPDLTLRQQRLISLVARGFTNKEIASHLNLSEFTVRNHIHRILKRLNAGNRSEAVEATRAYGYQIGP